MPGAHPHTLLSLLPHLRRPSLQGLPEDCQAALVGLLPPALGDWNVTEGLGMLDQYCGTAFANATATRLAVGEGEAGGRAAVRWLPACRSASCALLWGRWAVCPGAPQPAALSCLLPGWLRALIPLLPAQLCVCLPLLPWPHHAELPALVAEAPAPSDSSSSSSSSVPEAGKSAAVPVASTMAAVSGHWVLAMPDTVA